MRKEPLPSANDVGAALLVAGSIIVTHTCSNKNHFYLVLFKKKCTFA